ncbi:MAG: hypothetical protein IOD08_03445, partial [Bradyrhizobium sp.]|uniref:hypothetical protein n=1 Tax=Bradyrhizobium sp. TaxID=376 RepID=UPI0025B866E2
VLICAAVLICIVGIQNLPVVGIFSFLWKVSPLLLLLAMTSGALILSSQVVASGQRLEGRDHFVLPSLALGVLSSIAMLLFGTTPLRVASISLAVSVVGLAAGILQTRRAYRAG